MKNLKKYLLAILATTNLLYGSQAVSTYANLSKIKTFGKPLIAQMNEAKTEATVEWALQVSLEELLEEDQTKAEVVLFELSQFLENNFKFQDIVDKWRDKFLPEFKKRYLKQRQSLSYSPPASSTVSA